MAYDFIGLVNDVNHRLNEVPLDLTNFDTAQGFYLSAKEAVNAALREIYQVAFEWPFTHQSLTTTLVVNQSRYAYPIDAKSVNMDSFRIKGDDTKNVTTNKLAILDYEEYLAKYSDAEFNGAKYANVPKYVVRTPSLEFILYPPAGADYELVYEYYRLPLDLTLPTDVPAVPEQFRHAIIDGAIHYAYMFRGDPESAGVVQQKFLQDIKNMRTIYQNRFEYLRSGVLNQ